jgi:putative ABC transport system permease protein
MKIPLKYNIRSLYVRRVGSFMTALGIGLTVAIVVVMLAMIYGLDSTFTETGHQDQLVVIRKGSQNEVNSYFSRSLFEVIRFLPGVARNADNEPLAVGELVVVINRNRKGGDASNLMVRGASDMSFHLRPELHIMEGRRFRDGLRELVVGRSVAERFQGLSLGDTVELNNNQWNVVGIFESEGGAYDSEIWAGYQDIAQVWDRPVFSSILLRADSLENRDRLVERISDDQRIQLDALSQRDYFSAQTVSSIGLKALTFFVAVIMGVGSCFAIMNMMYGTVMSRRQEVATLRALGFRRRSILGSFLVESGILALSGGVIGCALGALFNGYSAGTSNFATFSEVIFNFRITPEILLFGLLFALVVGMVGGFLPARRAATVRLIDVLRE